MNEHAQMNSGDVVKTKSWQLSELTKELNINSFSPLFVWQCLPTNNLVESCLAYDPRMEGCDWMRADHVMTTLRSDWSPGLWSENVKNDKNLRGETFYIVTSDLSKEFHTNIFLFKQLFLVFVAFQNLTISQLMITLQHSFCHSLKMMEKTEDYDIVYIHPKNKKKDYNQTSQLELLIRPWASKDNLKDYRKKSVVCFTVG